MKTELLLVRDGLEGASPWMAQVLRDAQFDDTSLYKDVLTNSSWI